MKPDLRTALALRPRVGDGAMATYLYQLGLPVGVSFEEFNLLKPGVIEDVHRRYAAAGAEIIETNTYSAQYNKLARYGLEKKTEEINAAGVAIARRAVSEDVYVVRTIRILYGELADDADVA